jgi:methionyl-tRNA formyltransferase
MVEVLGQLDGVVPEPQPEEGVTYASKIEKAEARLDFSRSAGEVERQVRAFNPTPGAYVEVKGERLKVLAADLLPGAGRGPEMPKPGPRPSPGNVLDDRLAIACGEGAIRPTLVQRAGRPPMRTDELLRGFPIPAGTILA